MATPKIVNTTQGRLARQTDGAVGYDIRTPNAFVIDAGQIMVIDTEMNFRFNGVQGQQFFPMILGRSGLAKQGLTVHTGGNNTYDADENFNF